MPDLGTPIARLDGSDATLADLTGGKPALLVNVASKCGLTPQYTALEALHEQYAGRGFTVVGVPCNQFGGQEPGSEAEIAEFCAATYNVKFPMFSKIEVNGAGRAPLYGWLAAAKSQPDGPGDIVWNFAKFVVGKDGQVKARFNPRIAPDDPALRAAIDSALTE